MLIKLAAVAALVAGAVAVRPYVLPAPGAGEVRVEITALKAFTPDSGTITGAETAKAWSHATVNAGVASGRVTTWTVTKAATKSTVNGVLGKAAVGYVCNIGVKTPPTASTVTCATP